MSENLMLIMSKLPGREIKFAAGEAVFRMGQTVRNVHLVKEGGINLARFQRDGSAIILQRASAGSVLAEASLHSSRYHCDAVASTKSTTWAVSRGALEQHLLKDPLLSQAWSQHLSREVQRARLHAEILSLKTVAARLDAWIAWHGKLPAKGLWTMVSRQIGVSPEALYRELAKRR